MILVSIFFKLGKALLITAILPMQTKCCEVGFAILEFLLQLYKSSGEMGMNYILWVDINYFKVDKYRESRLCYPFSLYLFY